MAVAAQRGWMTAYVSYVGSFLVSIALAAPVGFLISAYLSGAFLRFEFMSELALRAGVGGAAVVAGATFWFLTNFRNSRHVGLARISVVVAVSAIVLIALGQLAAHSLSLNGEMAAAIWFGLMLTIGYLPFATEQAER